ncbi:MAG: biopolymer transporter ExbD [Spirochaetaceae bacterium]|nr:biopolymer transporter ExbD [Spirochaetaceae bacterium]
MRLERRLKPTINIDLTPLIDVVYQLVIFFMITSVFKTAPGIPLELPGAATSAAVAVSELRIVAVSEEEIYVGRDRTTAAGLDVLVAKAVQAAGDKGLKAVLEGDKNMPYQLMVTILDALRANGVDGVGLQTRPGGPAATGTGRGAAAPKGAP